MRLNMYAPRAVPMMTPPRPKQTYADDYAAIQRQLFLGLYELFETSTSAECDYLVILNHSFM